MYKLIAADLDDTLLKDDLSISQVNKQAIKKAIEMGVIFTINTGRVTPAAVKYAQELDLQVPIISYQGASIYDFRSNKSIYSQHLSYATACQIINFAQEKNIHCNIYGEQTIYIKKFNKWSEYYKRLSKGMEMKAVGDLTQIDFKSTPKLILIDEEANIQKIKLEVEAVHIPNINIFTSKPNFLEITALKATKGCALEFYAAMYNIKREEVIAIGDSNNDLSMIKWAGFGVCMENGKENVKQVADYITSSNEKDGVAKVVNEFILS